MEDPIESNIEIPKDEPKKSGRSIRSQAQIEALAKGREVRRLKKLNKLKQKEEQTEPEPEPKEQQTEPEPKEQQTEPKEEIEPEPIEILEKRTQRERLLENLNIDEIIDNKIKQMQKPKKKYKFVNGMYVLNY